ncbi:MAG TPA: sulfite exporter TauE/SafE family protein [Flavobacterium lutivivi]|nr:sulfite exporter TauE/SafE family protein [Flavobacterium lutivivi]
MQEYWQFYVLALLCEVIGTVSGFGSSILFVPLASMFFEFKYVLGITAVFHVFSNLSKIYFFHKGIDKKILLQLGIPAVLFVALGAFLTTFINQKKLELAMNIVLLALSIYLVFNINKKLKMSNKNLVIGGVASGFLAGLVGTGGAIRGLVLASFSLEKNVFLATSALIDLGVDSTRAVIYINNGFFKKEFLITIPFLIAVSILGTWIGKRILAHVNEVLFRYIVILTIIATAIFQTVNYFGD